MSCVKTDSMRTQNLKRIEIFVKTYVIFENFDKFNAECLRFGSAVKQSLSGIASEMKFVLTHNNEFLAK